MHMPVGAGGQCQDVCVLPFFFVKLFKAFISGNLFIPKRGFRVVNPSAVTTLLCDPGQVPSHL